MSNSAPMRAAMGFIAAALSVLIFHQGMSGLMHVLQIPHMTAAAPYSMQPIRPFGVPSVLNLCFWGGLYGVLFGLALPWLRGPLWINGFVLGIIAVTVGRTLVAVAKGLPIGGDLSMYPLLRSLLVNCAWGIGVGLILPLLLPRLRAFRRA